MSIVTPAYNRASYLDETIQSVLGQDYPRIEYIVLDDGSTDGTREILQKYAGRIIWESHPNMGETRTVNKGFSMTHGDIVAVVNSDDPLLPSAVSTATAFMESNPDILVAYPDWDYIGPNSEVICRMQVREFDYLFMLRCHHCSPGPGAFIRRRALDLVGMRDPEFRYVADFDFWLRLGLYGEFARIPKTLATFRTHPGSTTASAKGEEMAHEHIRLLEKFYSCADLPPEVLRVRAEAYSWAYATAALCSKPASVMALRHLLRGTLCHPRSLLAKWQIGLSVVLPPPLLRQLARMKYSVYPLLIKGRQIVGRKSLRTHPE